MSKVVTKVEITVLDPWSLRLHAKAVIEDYSEKELAIGSIKSSAALCFERITEQMGEKE